MNDLTKHTRHALPRMLLICESLVLLLTGSVMAGLAVSERYWQLLNPKFAPLTLATGCALLLVGALHAFSSGAGGAGRARCSSLLAMALFLVLAGFALGPIGQGEKETAAEFDPGPPPASGSLFSPDERGDVDTGPRLTHQGHEYVKMNTVELWMQVDQGAELGETPGMDGPDLGTGGRVALRAQVRALPDDPDCARHFAVVRIAVACCLADAVASGYVVEGPLPQGLKDGDWVRLLARVVPLSGPVPRLGDVSTPGVTLTVLHEQVALSPEAVTPEPIPQPPFLFEFRMDEPFAW